MPLRESLPSPDQVRDFLREALKDEELLSRVRDYLGEKWALNPERINNWRSRGVPHQAQEGAALVLLGMPELIDQAGKKNPLSARTAWHVHYLAYGEDPKRLDCYAFRYWEEIQTDRGARKNKHNLTHRGLFEPNIDRKDRDVVGPIGDAVRFVPRWIKEFEKGKERVQFQAAIKRGGADAAGYSICVKGANAASVEDSNEDPDWRLFREVHTAMTRIPTERTNLVLSIPDSAHKDFFPYALSCTNSVDPWSLILTLVRQESLNEAFINPKGELYGYADLVQLRQMEEYLGEPPMPRELEKAVRERLTKALPGQDVDLTVMDSRRTFIARFDKLMPDTSQAILYELHHRRKVAPAE